MRAGQGVASGNICRQIPILNAGGSRERLPQSGDNLAAVGPAANTAGADLRVDLRAAAAPASPVSFASRAVRADREKTKKIGDQAVPEFAVKELRRS